MADDEDGHELALVCHEAGLGWWAECDCTWISRSRHTEDAALAAHQAHRKRETGRG